MGGDGDPVLPPRCADGHAGRHRGGPRGPSAAARPGPAARRRRALTPGRPDRAALGRSAPPAPRTSCTARRHAAPALEPGLPTRSGGSFIGSRLSGYRLGPAGSTFDLRTSVGSPGWPAARRGGTPDLYSRGTRPVARPLRRRAGTPRPDPSRVRRHRGRAGPRRPRGRRPRRGHRSAAARPAPAGRGSPRPSPRPGTAGAAAARVRGRRQAGRGGGGPAHRGGGGRPGPELRAAYERVTAAPPPARPAQLPPDPPFFSGRTGPLARAHRIVRADRGTTTVLVIDGMPGVGKTTLAVHLAHQLAATIPDGQLYADLRGFDADAALTPARRCAVPERARRAAGRLPGELHGRPGFPQRPRRAAGADRARQLPRRRAGPALLPGSADCLVIVTSRPADRLLAARAPPAPARTCRSRRGTRAARPAARPGPGRRRSPHVVDAGSSSDAGGCRWPSRVSRAGGRAPGVPLGRIAAELPSRAAASTGSAARSAHRSARGLLLVLPGAVPAGGAAVPADCRCIPGRT